MTKHKKLSKGRGVVIPKDMAAFVGLNAGDAVDLIADNGVISIRRHAKVCRFCTSVEVKEYGGISVCKECAAKLYKEVCG